MDTPHAEYLEWFAQPSLREPIVIAAFEGWNDAGEAASSAVEALRSRWSLEPLASIDPEPFYDFTAARPTIELDETGGRALHWPAPELHYGELPGHDRDVIVVSAYEPGLRWRTFCELLMGLAAAHGASRLITLGALLAEVPHSRPTVVYGSTEDPGLAAELDLAPSTYEGPTGIVGILTVAGRDAGLPTLSLWAAVPNYLPGTNSPKATLALLERIAEVTGATLSTTDLEIASASFERQVSAVVAADDETAEYVTALEEQFDHDDLDDDPVESVDLVDGDLLVEQVEQFLRDNPDS